MGSKFKSLKSDEFKETGFCLHCIAVSFILRYACGCLRRGYRMQRFSHLIGHRTHFFDQLIKQRFCKALTRNPVLVYLPSYQTFIFFCILATV